MTNIVSLTCDDEDDIAGDPFCNGSIAIQQFIENKVNTPLCLGGVDLGVIEVDGIICGGDKTENRDRKRDSVIDQDSNEVIVSQSFLESATSFVTTAKGPDFAGNVPTKEIAGLIERMVQSVMEGLGNLVMLYYQYYNEQDQSHTIFVKRSLLCKDLKSEVQECVNKCLALSSLRGKKSGETTLKEVIGTEKGDMRRCVFIRHGMVKDEHGPCGPVGRKVPIKLDTLDRRKTEHIPHHVREVKDSWEVVETQVKLMLGFQLRTVLGESPKVLRDIYGDDYGQCTRVQKIQLEEKVADAISETLQLGWHYGFQSGQTWFKNMHGIYNNWVYSFVDWEGEDDAIRVWRPKKLVLLETSQQFKRQKIVVD